MDLPNSMSLVEIGKLMDQEIKKVKVDFLQNLH